MLERLRQRSRSTPQRRREDLTVGEFFVEVTWNRKQKTIRMGVPGERVDLPSGSLIRVRVSVPWRFPSAGVPEIINAQADLLRRRYLQAQQLPHRIYEDEPQRPELGGQITLWGQVRRIEVKVGPRIRAELRGEKVELTLPADGDYVTEKPDPPDPEKVRAALQRLKRELVQDAVKRFAPPIEAAFEIQAAGYSIREMKSRWGSATPATRKIRIASRLVHYPPAALRYVLAHEIAHLRQAHHQSEFWKLLEACYPAWRQGHAILHSRTAIQKPRKTLN